MGNRVSGRPAGRTVLIMGAATGIGRAAAELFASNGARAVLFGLGGSSPDQLTERTGAVAYVGVSVRARILRF